jgi:predicted nucleic acid-binding protein
MNNSLVNKSILLDTGLWYAFYDKNDQPYHEEALKIRDFIFNHKILIPWPICYEVLRTKFVKNNYILKLFEKDLKKTNIIYLNDEPYRSDSLNDLFSGYAKNIKNENLSLVDILINKIILDKNIKINYLATFNKKDFELSCKKRKIDIYPI